MKAAPYDRMYRELGRRDPNAGYGGSFYAWLFEEEPEPIETTVRGLLPAEFIEVVDAFDRRYPPRT